MYFLLYKGGKRKTRYINIRQFKNLKLQEICWPSRFHRVLQNREKINCSIDYKKGFLKLVWTSLKQFILSLFCCYKENFQVTFGHFRTGGALSDQILVLLGHKLFTLLSWNGYIFLCCVYFLLESSLKVKKLGADTLTCILWNV